MEGIGSRLGRASSRYGSAPVFTGPVRRWQKQWIHISSSSSPSSSSTSYNHSKNFNSNGGNSNDVSAIRLRRWTPVPPAHPGGDSVGVTEERPRRKLRYTPIVVLEEKKKEAGKTERDTIFAAEAQASDRSEAAKQDLNTTATDDYNDNDDSDDSNKEAEWVKAAQKGFAR